MSLFESGLGRTELSDSPMAPFPPEPPSSGSLPSGNSQDEVEIPLRPGLSLPGTLWLPHKPRGIVVFAHGSGSSRHSPRNRYVASVLVEAGFAALLFDLLTGLEASDRRKVFDIELLADRLVCKQRHGRCSNRGSPACRVASLGRARAVRRLCWRLQAIRRSWRPSSPAAGGPTWRVRTSPSSAPPPC